MCFPTIFRVARYALFLSLSSPVLAQVNMDLEWIHGGHSSTVTSVDYSPSGNRIVTGSRDGTLKRWSLLTGSIVDTLSFGVVPISDVAWSPAGTAIASVDLEGNVSVHDLGGGPVLVNSTGESPLRTIAWSSDGQRVFAGGDGLEIHIIENGVVSGVIDGFSAPIVELALSPNGELLASGCADGSLALWRTEDLGLEGQLTLQDRSISSLSFSPDGTMIAACDATRIRVFRTDTTAVLADYDETGNAIESVDFCQNAELLIATHGGVLHRRLLATGEDVATVDTGTAIHTIVCDPGGSTFVAGFVFGGVAHCLSSTLEFSSLLAHQGGSQHFVAFSLDGSHVCSGAGGIQAQIWKAIDGAFVSNNLPLLPAGPFDVNHLLTGDVEFTSDGQAYAGACVDGKIRVWRTSNGALLKTVHATHLAATTVALTSGDTRALVGTEGGMIRSFEVASGAAEYVIAAHDDWVLGLDTSPDEQLIASAGRDGRVRLWNAGDGSLAFDLGMHENGVFAVCFAPDGNIVASGGADGLVRLWNPFDGSLIREIPTMTNRVRALVVSPESDKIAASIGRGDLRFYEVATGDDITGSLPEAHRVTKLAWIGNSMLLGRDDGTLVMLSANP